MKHNEILESLLQISLKAGAAIMDVYNDPNLSTHEIKNDGSPLTKADLASNKVITDSLTQMWPEIPIISEEDTRTPYSQRKNWKRFWLVDPLDGTKEFIKRNGEFTTNIALIEDNLPILGVVHAPALKLSYFGSEQTGSFKLQNGNKSRIYSIEKKKPINLTIVESRSHSVELPKILLSKISIAKRIVSGSSIKLCLVADGSADIYPRLAPTMEWDVAAGDAIFRHSGKEKPRQSPLIYNKQDLKNKAFILGLPEGIWNAS